MLPELTAPTGREPAGDGGHNPSSRRAVCEKHKYGSVRGAPGNGGAYLEPIPVGHPATGNPEDTGGRIAYWDRFLGALGMTSGRKVKRRQKQVDNSQMQATGRRKPTGK
jgi:hypothetical protein